MHGRQNVRTAHILQNELKWLLYLSVLCVRWTLSLPRQHITPAVSIQEIRHIQRVEEKKIWKTFFKSTRGFAQGNKPNVFRSGINPNVFTPVDKRDY